jgi:hypothetical protein
MARASYLNETLNRQARGRIHHDHKVGIGGLYQLAPRSVSEHVAGAAGYVEDISSLRCPKFA